MRTTSSLLALFALAAFGAFQAKADDICNIGAANLVTNCGFETGDLTGWTVTGTDSGPNQLGNEYGVDQLAVYSGSYAGFFGAIGGVMDVSQTIATTAGQQYIVSFQIGQDISPVNPYKNSLEVSFDGIDLITPETQLAASPYTGYTYHITAVDSSSVLQFAFENDLGYFGVDSVVVEANPDSATPEPSTLWMMGAALLIAGAVFLRRRIRAEV